MGAARRKDEQELSKLSSILNFHSALTAGNAGSTFLVLRRESGGSGGQKTTRRRDSKGDEDARDSHGLRT